MAEPDHVQSSNVRVITRVRPPFVPDETGCVSCISNRTLEVMSQDGTSLHFPCDKVHGLPNGASNTQADIFSDVQDIVLSTLEGLNGCIMAYGQTGSGKTYTLAGDLDSSTDQGLISRSINHLIQGISRIKDGSRFQVYLSEGEIDDLKDLKDLVHYDLSSTSQPDQQEEELSTPVAEAIKAATVVHELVELTQQPTGLDRAVAACTSYSAASSPFHWSVTLTLQRHLTDGSVMQGKLIFVDLKGLDQQDKTLALAVALQVALGVEAHMALIVCCSPAAANAAEALSSLRFGAWAQRTMTSVQVHPFQQVLRQCPLAVRRAACADQESLMRLEIDNNRALERAARMATARARMETASLMELISVSVKAIETTEALIARAKELHEETARTPREAHAGMQAPRDERPGLNRMLMDTLRDIGQAVWVISKIILPIVVLFCLEVWVPYPSRQSAKYSHAIDRRNNNTWGAQ